MKKNCSAIILSAGKSERMNSHKAFLLFDKKNRITFIEQIIKTYNQFGCEDIVIVFNSLNVEETKKYKLNAKIIVNEEYELGRFSSIKKGINAIKKNNFCFIHNIDNPFITVSILDKIYSAKKNNFYISPKYKNKGGHPILLSPEIITEIQTEISKNLNLRDFLQPFSRKNVFIKEKKILFNINTKEDYNQLFK